MNHDNFGFIYHIRVKKKKLMQSYKYNIGLSLAPIYPLSLFRKQIRAWTAANPTCQDSTQAVYPQPSIRIPSPSPVRMAQIRTGPMATLEMWSRVAIAVPRLRPLLHSGITARCHVHVSGDCYYVEMFVLRWPTRHIHMLNVINCCPFCY